MSCHYVNNQVICYKAEACEYAKEHIPVSLPGMLFHYKAYSYYKSSKLDA